MRATKKLVAVSFAHFTKYVKQTLAMQDKVTTAVRKIQHDLSFCKNHRNRT